MAAKKNPLSSLLQSNRRVQASDFDKDYTVSSTVGQAGNYAIGYSRPVPISQTSMGRLAEALGQTSGILKEFSDYQIKKDQLALQKDQLAAQLEGQDIAAQQAVFELENAKLRGSVLSETIKQQNIKLDMMQQEREVADFNAEWEGKTPEERREWLASSSQMVKETEEKADKALAKATIAAAKEGTEEAQLPFKALYAASKRGASHFDSFVTFFDKNAQNIFQSLNETTTSGEAQDFVEQIVNDYMVLNGLEAGSQEAKGFLQATSGFLRKRIPQTVEDLMEGVTSLSIESENYAVFKTVEGGGQLDDLQIANLQTRVSQGKHIEFLYGREGNGKGGLWRTVLSSNDPTVLSNFQSVHSQIGERLIVNGKPFEETQAFLVFSGELVDKIEDLKSKKYQDDERNLRKAEENARNVLINTGGDRDPEVLLANLQKIPLLNSEGTLSPEEIREGIVEAVPELEEVVKTVADDDIAGFAFGIVREAPAIFEELRAIPNKIIGKATRGYADLSEPQNATRVFEEVSRIFEASSAREEEAGLVIDYLGLDGRLVEYDVAKFNEETRKGGKLGAIDRYISGKEDLAQELRDRFDDLTQAKDFADNKLRELDDRLREDIQSFFIEKVKAKKQFIEKPPLSIFSQATVREAQTTNPTFDTELTFKSLKDQLKPRVFRDGTQLSDEELSKAAANLEEIRRISEETEIEREERFKGLARSVVDSYSYFGDDKEKLYEENRLLIEAAKQTKLRTGVTGKEVLDIAITAESLKYAQTAPEDDPELKKVWKDPELIPLVLREDQYRKAPNDAWDRAGFGESQEEALRRKAIERLTDISVPRKFFYYNVPPLTELSFGAEEPKGQEDIDTALRQIEGVDTEEDLKTIASLYGYESTLEFLKAQYKTIYHTNLRRNK